MIPNPIEGALQIGGYHPSPTRISPNSRPSPPSPSSNPPSSPSSSKIGLTSITGGVLAFLSPLPLPLLPALCIPGLDSVGELGTGIGAKYGYPYGCVLGIASLDLSPSAEELSEENENDRRERDEEDAEEEEEYGDIPMLSPKLRRRGDELRELGSEARRWGEGREGRMAEVM